MVLPAFLDSIPPSRGPHRAPALFSRQLPGTTLGATIPQCPLEAAHAGGRRALLPPAILLSNFEHSKRL
jgi:hypothetical protein